MSWGFNPFEERELPPMSAEMFTTLVVARLRSGGIAVEAQRRLELTLPLAGAATVAHLDSYYRRYRAKPGALTPLIEEFIEDLTKNKGDAAPIDSFERAAPKLLPLLISSAEWQKKKEAGVRIVVRPLVQDLGIALVVDEPEAITYLELERVAGWGVDIASAYDRAMDNLERAARDVPFSQTGGGEETLLIDRAADGYAATRAVVRARMEDWSRRVQGELVLGIPNRGFLVGFSNKHPNLDALAGQVQNDARADEHGLSARLLVWRRGELGIYDKDGG